MARGISYDGVEQAIKDVIQEREIRRKMFASDTDKQHGKVLQMNKVLDYLRWCRNMLEIPGDQTANNTGDGRGAVAPVRSIGSQLGRHHTER